MRSALRRLLLSCLLTGSLIGLAYGGLFVTAAPEAVSLAVEPFSLLLMPGLLVALAIAGQHDFSPAVVLLASAGFYLIFFVGALSWRMRRLRAHRGSR